MLSKLSKAEDLVHHFPHGSFIGWSGFTGVGYPKCVCLSSPIFFSLFSFSFSFSAIGLLLTD